MGRAGWTEPSVSLRRGSGVRMGVSRQSGRVLFRPDIRVACGEEVPKQGSILMGSSSKGSFSGGHMVSLGII